MIFLAWLRQLRCSIAWSRAPAMDGDGFDVWGSQPSASGPATHASLDLNSQAPASEGFPGLGLYGAFLQSDDDELLPGRVRGSGLPPYRPPYARRLNFGGSSSAAAGHGGNGGVFLGGSSSGAGGGVRQRANSAAAAPSRRNQRTSTAFSGGDVRQRANSAAAAPSRRAPRSAVRGQASSSGAPFDNGDEELEDDVEELASSGGPSEEDHVPMTEEEEYDGGSTSEDEIISMCRNNLVQSENLILKLVPILGMYSDNYFVKLPRRVSGYSGLDWLQETLARDTQ